MLSFHHQLLYIAKYASLRIFERKVYYAFLSTEYIGTAETELPPQYLGLGETAQISLLCFLKCCLI